MSQEAKSGQNTVGEDLSQRVTLLENSLAECKRTALANDFAAAVMHEVNNPLEAITNLIYLARHDSDRAEVDRYLTQVEEQLSVLASIARSSLTFYRGQTEVRDINLAEIAESALKLHMSRLSRAQIRVETSYCNDTSARGISSELLQIVSNLLLNAVDALTDVADPAIRVDVRRTRNALRLTIRDNGPGIPSSMEERLFQAHATGKKTGSGLGLWLSRRIAEKHGGALQFRTSRREGASGTLFRLRIPVPSAAAS